jgi:hypothetical protein
MTFPRDIDIFLVWNRFFVLMLSYLGEKRETFRTKLREPDSISLGSLFPLGWNLLPCSSLTSQRLLTKNPDDCEGSAVWETCCNPYLWGFVAIFNKCPVIRCLILGKKVVNNYYKSFPSNFSSPLSWNSCPLWILNSLTNEDRKVRKWYIS